jgi:hypothetical protein
MSNLRGLRQSKILVGFVTGGQMFVAHASAVHKKPHAGSNQVQSFYL